MKINFDPAIYFLIWLFTPKKGCLRGKTKKQKHDFFKSLTGFIKTDPEFFRQQYCDLKTPNLANSQYTNYKLSTYQQPIK